MTGDWHRKALCARLDPDDVARIFCGDERNRLKAKDVAEGRLVCESCPVIFECLEESLTLPWYHDRVGIRGGLLPDERHSLREDSTTGYGVLRGGRNDGSRRARPEMADWEREPSGRLRPRRTGLTASCDTEMTQTVVYRRLAP